MNAKQDYVRTIEEQIDSIPMSRYERDAAYRYLRIGALFTDVVVWLCKPGGQGSGKYPDVGTSAVRGAGSCGFHDSEIEGNSIC